MKKSEHVGTTIWKHHIHDLLFIWNPNFDRWKSNQTIKLGFYIEKKNILIMMHDLNLGKKKRKSQN